MKHIVISYIPLLVYAKRFFEPNEFKSVLKKIERQIAKQHGHATACLWISENGAPSAILALQQAKKISKHLMQWAENDPSKWFHIELDRVGDKYGLILMPNMDQSVRRYKMANLQFKEEIVTTNDIQLLFEPIRFSSIGGKTTFDQLESQIKSEMTLYFIEESYLKRNVDKIDAKKLEKNAIKIGKFEVKRKSDYLAKWLSD